VTGTLTGSTAFRALLTAACLAYLAWTIDLGATARALGRLSLAVAAIVLMLLALDRVIIIWRWLILIRASGHNVAAKSVAWIYLVSSFVGIPTPAGMGGDAVRAYTLSQRTSEGGAAVASVAADRLLGLTAILLVGLCGALFWQHGDQARLILATATFICLAASLTFLWAGSLVRAVLPRAIAERRIGIRLMRYADALSAYRHRRTALLSVLALSVGVQVLRILQAYLLGRGIGVDADLSYYFVFMPIGLIGLLLPIHISGFGLPQGLIVWLLAPVGVPQADALALSTLIVLSGIVSNLPGALLYLRSRGQPSGPVRT
jgi:uncharacterized protein (TIRG00374 family)